MPDPRQTRRRGLRRAGIALLVLLVVLAAQVEDWSRDLTTNVAATDPHARDAGLHPILSAASLDDLVDVVRRSAQGLPRWELGELEQRRGRCTLRLRRTSALFRFVDDVTVVIEDQGDRRVISAESRSRLGKGDLGQNPRNLKALLGRVRELLQR